MSHSAEAVKVASFDLYDTVVMRRSLSAKSLYSLVWSELQKSGTPLPSCQEFVTSRLRADVDSKHIDAPSLRQILEHLDNNLRVFSAKIEEVEIQIELAQLRAIPGARERIDCARRAGHQIAFISDMHIGSEHLRPRIQELGLLQAEDLLVVSSDHSVSKSRGGLLFDYFKKSFNIPAPAIVHHGNNHWSDVKMAEKHGIAAQLYEAGNVNRFETLMIDSAERCAALERLASVSRDIRLEYGIGGGVAATGSSREEDALSKIASSVVGPVFLAFVVWAVKVCKDKSINTVRFLTRDGELPFEIAKLLPEELTEGMDLGMLEVSRKSLKLPAASAMPLEKWLEVGLKPGAFLIQHYDRLPASEVISRVGLSFADHADLLNQFDISDPVEPLGKLGLLNWKRALSSDKVRQIIREKSELAYQPTVAYLEQNLSYSSKKRAALIDIGWTGQQSAMLSALIRQSGGQDPLHLHLGRLRDRPLVIEADIESWISFNRERRTPFESPVALFETFCATVSGGVDGYHLDHNGIASSTRREQSHQSAVVSWGQPLLRSCVLEFAKRAGGSASEIEPELLRDVCVKLLREFWEKPNRYEAKRWGTFPYEQDQTGQSIRQLANPYNIAQLRARVGNYYSGADWKAGSIELSPSPLRELLKVREMCRRRNNPDSIVDSVE